MKELTLDPLKVKKILAAVAARDLTVEQALADLQDMPFIDVGHSLIDSQRAARTGFPEVIYCRNKTVNQIVDICAAMQERQIDVLATALEPAVWGRLSRHLSGAHYNPLAKTMRLPAADKAPCAEPHIAIVAAGTSDLPVVAEAAETIEAFGYRADQIVDVGVAGIQRLFAKLARIKRADVVIVVAGMEGALPSVVAGLIDRPIIAVPTSVGYGASFGGLSALLTMLNSCAAGVSVVNIDNGFGAAYSAVQILRLLVERGRNDKV